MPEPAIGAMPIPATPLSELERWQLEIRCGRCGRDRVLELESLSRRHGNVPIIDVVRRLRCAVPVADKTCGGEPSLVVMVEIGPNWAQRRRLREIIVWGGLAASQ